MSINGKTVIGNLDMKVADAKNISSVGLDIASVDFDAPFRVKEFVVYVFTPGSRIYFEDIKEQSPEDIRDFPMVKVTVK